MNKWVGLVVTTVFCLIIFSSVLIAQESQAKPKEIQIVDAKLGKDVKDRMIADEATTFDLNSKVFIWLKVTGGTSETITVTWKLGEQKHETKLTIGGTPWRTWASKTAFKAGDWTVTVLDASGNVLKEMSFKVQ